ncbi:MAG TPA: deoxyribonuclease IV [Acidimicrobiia bacterium]|nr:deoxyribonuclease IV [Acidimicrobiia bacterium]
MRAVGAHVPSLRPIEEARERGADLVQIFLSDPQAWKKPLPRADAAELRASSIPVYVHSPYLINVCADNTRIRVPSRRILQETCDAAAEIAATAVVVHGGHVTGEGPQEEGLARWRKALEPLDTQVPVLIENTAGGDKALARRVEWIARLFAEVAEFDVGFVLDTCHVWAGGEPFDELVPRVMEATGRIDLVHANDSKDPFDSRRDRHENLGRGRIPPGDLARVIAEADAPVVVETPGGAAEQGTDIEWVRAAVSARHG